MNENKKQPIACDDWCIGIAVKRESLKFINVARGICPHFSFLAHIYKLRVVAVNRARWRVGVGEIAVKVGKIRPPPFTGINPDQNWIDDDE